MSTLPPVPDPATNPNPHALQGPPYYYTTYGPDANCTLAVCPAKLSVYQYQPSLSANAVFLAFFAVAAILHSIQLIIYRTKTYSILMVVGCLGEILGYAGRLMLHSNPFSFNGFLLQIITISFAPVFFTAAIYVTLSRIVIYLSPSLARFKPSFYYNVFIPCDVISLVLQATGGAMSSQSSGKSNTAVGISIAGLVFQVFTLVVFIGFSLEYAWRYHKASSEHIVSIGGRVKSELGPKFKTFIIALSAAIIFILIRCIYRIDELRGGYSGPLIANEKLFIALEGVMIVIATYILLLSNPRPAMGAHASRRPEEKV